MNVTRLYYCKPAGLNFQVKGCGRIYIFRRKYGPRYELLVNIRIDVHNEMLGKHRMRNFSYFYINVKASVRKVAVRMRNGLSNPA